MQQGDSDRREAELTERSVMALYQHLVRRVTSAPRLPFSSVSISLCLSPVSPSLTFSPCLPHRLTGPTEHPKCAGAAPLFFHRLAQCQRRPHMHTHAPIKKYN